jgi:mono/diheme cytochrome c family protein
MNNRLTVMRKTNRSILGVLAISALPAWAAVTTAPTKEQTEFFEQKIRPVLAEHCYQCHSEEQGKAKGGLTLDTKAGWQKGGDGGPAIVPGDVEKSLFHKALTHTDDDLKMPPLSKGGKLSDTQIADFAAWIKMGAPDPRVEPPKKAAKLSGLNPKAKAHWAYQPVTKPALPSPKNPQWGRTPVDAFILQKLQENGMTPSPDADRETLLRRVTFDLTGLPPTYAEVNAFIADPAPNAFEKVVDRLLASPSYGERWGRHWLDTARYSDTIGGDRNAARTTEYRYPDAWTYRDYVIRAMNEDKPYDQFIKEQLAADLLPDAKANDPRLAALGFLTVGERFRNVNDIINDRIDTVSKGFLAMTVSCARCHDHMFDPVSMRDYYALHGVFSSTTEPDNKPSLNARATEEQRKDFQAKLATGTTELRNRYYGAIDHYLQDFMRAPAAYLKAASFTARGGTEEAIKARNALQRENKLDEQFVQYLSRGIQRNPAVWGPLVQSKNGGYKSRKIDASDPKRLARMEEKLGEKLGDKAAMLSKQIAERSKGGVNPIIEAAFEAKQPKNFDEAVAVYAEIFAGMKDKSKGLIPAMKAATSQTVEGYDAATIDLLRGPFEVAPAPLATRDWVELAIAGWPNQLLGRARLNFGEINLLETSHPGAPAHAMVLNDKPKAVNSPIFLRGQQTVKGDIVPRSFLEILSPDHKPVEFKQGSGRLELAEQIASKNNPLTARVIVNRIWMHHFGEGFVRTPDDLGVMSEKPTHPELLDYLATYLMDKNWSMKSLHKLIVMSRVYQVSSHTRPDFAVKDPENRLLWRANVRRLDFEATRDSLLVYSGQLDRTLGGKPINLTDEPYSFRRTVYGYVDRGNLPDLMAHFDFSDPDMPNSKRTTTVVPQQALFLMNSPMAVDIARKILLRPEVQKASADAHRIMAIYRIIFQRSVTPTELQMALSFIQTESQGQEETEAAMKGHIASAVKRADFKAKRKLAGNDAKFGAIKNDGEVVARKALTPWETYVQALLFANEAAYLN